MLTSGNLVNERRGKETPSSKFVRNRDRANSATSTGCHVTLASQQGDGLSKEAIFHIITGIFSHSGALRIVSKYDNVYELVSAGRRRRQVTRETTPRCHAHPRALRPATP